MRPGKGSRIRANTGNGRRPGRQSCARGPGEKRTPTASAILQQSMKCVPDACRCQVEPRTISGARQCVATPKHGNNDRAMWVDTITLTSVWVALKATYNVITRIGTTQVRWIVLYFAITSPFLARLPSP